MALIVVAVFFHFILMQVLYGYTEPYFYKFVSGEEKARTHASRRINLRRASTITDLDFFMTYIPVLHFFAWMKFNRWLSNQLFNSDLYSLRMTLFGPVYYPYFALKLSMESSRG
ncbi:hypothetical protein [Pseudodesulfovibrio sediminis]|uniref:Uncharacterized protein n=1 Tax=Pseudodesulfovibrio sediminis TaxID=2810563 RepID=A0ABN6EPU4_9BACT|nr:hypothetical protein [Pseudodesulfovibrio sediminis]BCS87134.1 hypothetical protein PSDVSF_03760 [Pseudodesulfovibrio sediminis]